MTYDDAIAAIAESIDPGIITGAGIDHLSYSNLRLYGECSRKWAYKYRDKALRFRKTFPMAVGSGIHRSVERYHLGDAPESAVEAGVAKFEEEMGAITTHELAEAKNAVQRMFNCYSEKYKMAADWTEQEVDVDLAHGLTLKVVVDLVQDGVVADIKSIARDRKRFTPDELQLFFGLLAAHSKGMTLENAEIRPLRRDVTGARAAIALEPFPFTATEEWIEKNTKQTVEAIKDMQARLKTDMWDGPAYEMKWLCNRCEAAATCEIINKPIEFTGSLI